jgi:GTP-binding protein
MIIRSASFVKSSETLSQCPAPKKPEFGFIGRSNVGKSSLINMLLGYSGLAKTSGEPGKTRTINHFEINEAWYIADLPGYGYAKVPIKLRDKWQRNTREYILKRDNLLCLMVLLDSRHKPQKSDIDFMEFLGINQVPFARVFTKTDKITGRQLKESIALYDSEMLTKWESLPVSFTTSSKSREGRDELISFIEENLNKFSNYPRLMEE